MKLQPVSYWAHRFLPNDLVNLAAWYRFNQGITSAGGTVSQWNDASVNARHAVQANATQQLTLKANGTLRAFRTVDSLAKAFTLNQPATVYILFRALTYAFAGSIFDGFTAGSALTRQLFSSPELSMYSGSAGPASSALPLMQYGVLCAVWNGASSLLQIDGNAPVTGDPGSTNLGGVVLASYGGGGFSCDAQYAEFVVYSGAHDAPTRALVMAYLDTVKALIVTPAIDIISPAPFKVFQRSGTTGSITIAGVVETSGAAVEASFNGGSYVAMTTTGYTFSGTLTGQAQGQGTLTVRKVASPGVTATVPYVGIGDVYVVAGQSNAVGQGTSNQVYTHANLKAGLYKNDRWVELLDPTDAGGFGSVWPLITTSLLADQGIPVGFITTAASGSAITAWQKAAAVYYNTMTSRISGAATGGVKAVLWWQGETDALNGMVQATYSSNLTALANDVHTDFGVKLMPAKLQNCSGISAPAQAEINNAIVAAWGVGNVLTGPDLSGIPTDDAYHLLTDAHLASAAALWKTKIELIP